MTYLWLAAWSVAILALCAGALTGCGQDYRSAPEKKLAAYEACQKLGGILFTAKYDNGMDAYYVCKEK